MLQIIANTKTTIYYWTKSIWYWSQKGSPLQLFLQYPLTVAYDLVRVQEKCSFQQNYKHNRRIKKQLHQWLLMIVFN